MKTIALVQARMGSSRLPGKMLMPIGGKSLLEMVIRGLKDSKNLDGIVLCTSTSPENQALLSLAHHLDIKSFAGDENDVLKRFVDAAQISKADIIVRICADNPFVNGEEIDRLIKYFKSNDYHYAFNHIPRWGNSYPDGLGAEIVMAKILEQIHLDHSLTMSDREHVTKYIVDNKDKFKVGTLIAPPHLAYPEVKLDIDTKEDYDKMCLLYNTANEKGLNIKNPAELCKLYLSLFP